MESHSTQRCAATQRALDHYFKPEPTAKGLPLQVRQGVKHQEALGHASELLKCASAAAYESADQLRGASRDMAMAVVHMVEMASVLVNSALDTGEMWLKTTEGK